MMMRMLVLALVMMKEENTLKNIDDKIKTLKSDLETQKAREKPEEVYTIEADAVYVNDLETRRREQIESRKKYEKTMRDLKLHEKLKLDSAPAPTPAPAPAPVPAPAPAPAPAAPTEKLELEEYYYVDKEADSIIDNVVKDFNDNFKDYITKEINTPTYTALKLETAVEHAP